MVNAGDIVTCQITTVTTEFQSADDVVAAVSSILAQGGYGTLTASTQSAGLLDSVLSLGATLPFQATMQIQSPAAFAQPTDLLSIVENAFYQVTGSYPTAATVPSVTPVGGSSQATGLPSQTANQIGGTGSGFTAAAGSSVGSLASGLQSLLSNGLLLVAILIGVLIFVAGYSPNTRHIAGALA